MITATIDGTLRTHEDVYQLLSYTVPGARVTLHPIGKPGNADRNEGARRYEITVPRIGREPLPTCDMYTLPCPADTLARRARELADYALRA